MSNLNLFLVKISLVYQHATTRPFQTNDDLTSLSSYESSSSSVSSISSNATGTATRIELPKTQEHFQPDLQLNDEYLNYIEHLKANRSKRAISGNTAPIARPFAHSAFKNLPLHRQNSQERNQQQLASFQSSTETILLNPNRGRPNRNEPITGSVNKLAERIQNLPNMTNSGGTVKSSLSRRESYLNIFKAAEVSTDSAMDDQEDVRV